MALVQLIWPHVEQQALASKWVYSTVGTTNYWGNLSNAGAYDDTNNFSITNAANGAKHLVLFVCPSNPTGMFTTWNSQFLMYNYAGNFGGNTTSSTHSQYLATARRSGSPLRGKSIYRQSGIPRSTRPW